MTETTEALAMESESVTVAAPPKVSKKCRVDKMKLIKFSVSYVVCFVLTLGSAMAMQINMLIPVTYFRGFDLADRTIGQPHRDSRVSGNQNIAITFIVLYMTFLIQSIINIPCNTGKKEGVKKVLACIKNFLTNLNFWFQCLAILYGMVVCNFFTNLIKTSAAVLKPHFIDVCEPNATIVASLAPSTWVDGDLSRTICTGDDDLLNYRRSFPSGHASQAGYSMIMAIIVVQAAKVGPEWYPLKALIQLLLAMYLNFISFDRIKDHHHAWDDTLAGVILGLVIALVTWYGYINKGRTREDLNLPAKAVGK